MKNLLLLLVLLCTCPLFSQVKSEDSPVEPPKGKFSLSVIGGLNISKMPFRHPETSSELVIPKTRSEYAFFGGLSARQPLTNKFSVLLDASYSVRGFGYLSSNEISRVRFEYLWYKINPDFVQLANDVDFGIVPGVTLRFDRVSVLARYQHGLVASSEVEVTDDNGATLGTVDRKNRTFQIGLGFRIL